MDQTKEEIYNEKNKELAMFFYSNKEPIHIRDRRFLSWNGFIIKVADNFIILDEFIAGKKTIFFSDIYDYIEPFDNSKRGKKI